MVKLENLTKKNQGHSLYPERAFLYVDRVAEKIKGLILNETERINLDEQEKEDLLLYEDGLGERLEAIYDISPSSMTLYLNFFATKEGKSYLKEFTGLELKSSNPEEIRKFLYAHSETLAGLDGNKRDELSAKTITYADNMLLENLYKRLDENGNIDFSCSDIPTPQRFQLLINPDQALKKISELRRFRKEKILKDIKDLKAKQVLSRLEQARLEILGMYRRKVNVMILEQYKWGILSFKKKKVIGNDSLAPAERQVIAQFPGLLSTQKNRSRVDKLFYGTSEDYDEDGSHILIPKELESYAQELAEMGEKIALSRSELIRQKGLDEKKLFEKNISPEQRAAWHEEVLASENLLSAYPSSTYSPDRLGPAPDNKWQHVLRPNRSSMGLGPSGQKVLLDSSTEPSSIVGTMAVACGHENAHILRVENMAKIPLRLMQKIGGSRTAVFSEGGSMHVQNKICETAFGYSDLPHTHYIKAMLEKKRGGNYMECTSAFFDSGMASVRKKLRNGEINEQAFKRDAKGRLKEALNRAKRLFADGISFESKSPFLTNSRDTAYLEQRYVLEKMEGLGLEKLAFVGGVDLDDLQVLLKLNLLDLDDISGPTYYSLEIWEREKEGYLLKAKT